VKRAAVEDLQDSSAEEMGWMEEMIGKASVAIFFRNLALHTC
jgi:hypothetical protein